MGRILLRIQTTDCPCGGADDHPYGEPEVEQHLGKPLPKADLEALLQPGLRHHQSQQNGDNDDEDEELVEERRGGALLHRVEEGAVPLVEPHLTEHVANEDREDGR